MTDFVPCDGDCPNHDWICELPAGHDGDHACAHDPAYLGWQRAQQIADKVASYRVYRDVIETTPDED
ncbi:MAG TPA: hypothetical protein VHA75_20040 [Rugosimonospora sp.]|nr:hypothetical protein [Rugosimonospora sp.]